MQRRDGEGAAPSSGVNLNELINRAANQAAEATQESPGGPIISEEQTRIFAALKNAGVSDRRAVELAGFPPTAAPAAGGGKKKRTKKYKKHTKKTLRRRRKLHR